MATWLHCCIKTGSVAALSQDKNFNIGGKLSSAMRKNYFHIKVVDSLENCIPYVNSVKYPPNVITGEVLPKHKFKYYVDIDDFFSSDLTLKTQIENPDTEVDPISGFQSLTILEERT